jgi:hypothetical protein
MPQQDEIAIGHPDLALFMSLEKELFKPSTRGSQEAVEKLLAEGFVEFGRSGRAYQRDEVIRSLSSEGSAARGEVIAEDFALKRLAGDVVLLTYRSFAVVEGRTERHALRSSIWTLADDRWRMVFHQATPIDVR